MFDRELRQARECIRTSRYVVSFHGVDEARKDGLTRFDLESIVLTGTIVERQRDNSTGDWKYLISGDTLNAQRAIVVAKFNPVGHLYMITVFREVSDP